jgi:hypothetical protein
VSTSHRCGGVGFQVSWSRVQPLLSLNLLPVTLEWSDSTLLLLCRLLKDGIKDSQFSIRYQYLLAALLCCCGKGLREEFNRQCWLVNTLAKLAQQVRESTPSARQVSRDTWRDCLYFWCGASPASSLLLSHPEQQNACDHL